MRPVPLLFLSDADVRAAMPSMRGQLALAEHALRALAGDAQLPAKIGVDPRPHASWAHAMPAWVPGPDADGSTDLLGMKFVSGFPANADRGLPAVHATLLMCDPTTGRPLAVMDAGPITAVRTAATSGVAVTAWGPRTPEPVVSLVGAGIQAQAHVEMLAHVLPGSRLRVHDRDPERAATLVRHAIASGAFADATISDRAVDAIEGSDVAITMVSFGPDRQGIPADAFRSTALVVTVDYDMCLPGAIAREASLFLVDEEGQFLANRATGVFDDYPEPSGTIGGRLDEPRPVGHVVVTHLGTGVADLVFGGAILETAWALGLGTTLPS